MTDASQSTPTSKKRKAVEPDCDKYGVPLPVDWENYDFGDDEWYCGEEHASVSTTDVPSTTTTTTALSTEAVTTMATKPTTSEPRKNDCKKHPDCTWQSHGKCGYCFYVTQTIHNTRNQDKTRGRQTYHLDISICEADKEKVMAFWTSTMDAAYIESNIGANCYNCGYGPLTPQQQPRHPHQLSMNRLDNNKPHDCDPEQTVPTCWQCNKYQHNMSMAKFHKAQVSWTAVEDAMKEVAAAEGFVFRDRLSHQRQKTQWEIARRHIAYWENRDALWKS